MLKDKRAGGFEEVSKPSIGIHMKKKKNYHGRNGAKKNRPVCGSTCQIPSFTTHPRRVQDKGPNVVRTFSILIIKTNSNRVVIFREQIYKTAKEQSKP